MPLSTKSAKKSASKEQLVMIGETQASTSIKSKTNKGNIISSLFNRNKSKNKNGAVSEGAPSLTYLYANSNVSNTHSNTSHNEEVVMLSKESNADVTHNFGNDESTKQLEEKSSEHRKSKKITIFNKLKRKSSGRTSTPLEETVLCDESCQSSKENVASGKCYAGFSEYSGLCCTSPEVPTITVLKQVLQFSARLQDSEYHLIQIFTKYLKDENLEKDLIDIVSGHAKLQLQIERRSQALASDMWKQQSDLYKTQEKTLTENLKEMVWQNRKLQEENELLMKRMDIINIQNEEASAERNGSGLIDRLHRSNERLRYKLSSMTQQLNELENNLLNERSRCGTLEEQFSACFSELQTEKANTQTIKMDHQLEVTSLRQQLDSKDCVIRDAIETRDALLEEIEKIKRKIPSLFETINYKKQTNIVNPLSNIMMMASFYLGVVVNKVLQLQQELSDAQSERNHFKTESLSFQKTLESTSNEIAVLAKQADLLNSTIKEKDECLQRIGIIEKEKITLENDLTEKNTQLEAIHAEKVFLMEGMHQVKDIVHAKDDELKCVKAENETLIFQNKSLSQIIMQSGSGDVARELASSQEKLQLVQSHYYQLISYKEQMEEKLRLSSNEIEVLKSTNSDLTKKLNTQAQTLNDLNEYKLKLKEELSNQQATLTALQNERRRHLAEKNFLRTIYDRIQNDASKAESLEGSLCEVSKEADRLAIIAEFNKQLGERYQNEIQERDAIICELKESIKNLNNTQQVSVKEKAALCEELTQMCSIKDILTSKLELEMKKSVHVTESAKATESTVNEELKALKEMQQIERCAVKELLENFNVLVVQKDNLLKYKGESEKQLAYLQEQVSCYQEEVCRKTKDLVEKEQAMIWLDKQLQTADEKMRCLTDKVECALRKQLADMEGLANENKKLTADNEKYRNSIEYLKSNIYNLQSSLDQTRKTENEYKKLFETQMEKCQSITDELKESNSKNFASTEELVVLREQFTQLKKEYVQLFSDHQDLAKSIPEQQQVLDRCRGSEGLIEEYQSELKILKEEVAAQSVKMKSLEKNSRKQLNLIEKLTGENSKLREDLLEVVSEKEILNNKLVLVSTESDKIKSELSGKTQLLEEKSKNEQHLEYNCVDAQRDLKDLMETLHNTEEKNVRIKSKLEIAQKMYRTLEDTHRKLAEKLLKTVHSLMNEKIARRSAETNLELLTKKIAKVELEKNDLMLKIKSQNDSIKNLERKFSDVESYKTQLEDKLKEAVTNYHEILSKYDEVIREFAATEIKCKEYEVKLDNYLATCPNCKDMEEKICNLKNSLNSSQDSIVYLQDAIANLNVNVTSLQFEKSENQLHLHDVEKQLEVERSLREKCQELNGKILMKTLELKEETKISKSVCDILLSVGHDHSL